MYGYFFISETLIAILFSSYFSLFIILVLFVISCDGFIFLLSLFVVSMSFSLAVHPVIILIIDIFSYVQDIVSNSLLSIPKQTIPNFSS